MVVGNMTTLLKQKSVVSVWSLEFTKKNMKKLYELSGFWKFVQAIFNILPFLLFVYFIIRSYLDFQEGKTGLHQVSVITVTAPVFGCKSILNFFPVPPYEIS